MQKKVGKFTKVLVSAILFVMISTSVFPVVSSSNTKNVEGYDKGPSYKPVVPLKKTTFVGFDEETYLDDYAYLAAVPTSVFDDGEHLYSNPLLFYTEPSSIEDKYDKEKSLNDRAGLDYFMEDWMGYCNGKMDQLTLINVPKQKMDSSWKARQTTEIESESPYKIASELALSEWSYSDDAVVAVIGEDFEESRNEVYGTFTGTLDAKNIETDHFEVKQTNRLDPVFDTFEVPEGYKYMKARAWYACIYLDINLGGFFQLANISIPSGDKDLQLYCNYNDAWMQTSAISGWNQKQGMDKEIAETYIYADGTWRASITDVPTKGGMGKYGTLPEIVKNMLGTITYQVDIELFPGTVVPIPETPPFGCRDATIKVTWDDPNLDLGLSLIGPAGEEILTEFNESRDTYQEMHLDQLGECLDAETYSVCIHSRGDLSSDVDFEVEYSWKQEILDQEGDALTSATEGAVLASALNAPLLYVKTSELPETTKETLYKLGIENIYLVDMGEQLTQNTKKQIENIAELNSHYLTEQEIYDDIRTITGNNDVIFSTVDPWTYWYAAEMKPAGEHDGGLYIGPAAYIAAHHGSPVLIIDNHPELSSSVVWHTEFWKRIAHDPGHNDPSVAEMHLTGVRVYDFLGKYGFDEVGRETIISVGGQYEIGPSWDRMFLGMAKAGKFFFTPTDTAYWIARNVFYPGLIFENPAMNPEGVKLETGSSSKRRTFLPYGKFGLKITEEEQEKTFKYPVHLTFVSYQHRYNERGATKYYGYKYECADGLIPGESRTFEPIDQDSIKLYTGKEGCFWPDMSLTDVMPFYLEKGGFECAYASNFPSTVENVNDGVLYWHLGSHGGQGDTGTFLFWDSAGHGSSVECSGLPLPPGAGAKKETNPWRAYDWYLGSTHEPDTLSVEAHGILPALTGNPNPKYPTIFRTAFDWAPAKKPILDKIGTIAGALPVIKRIAPDWLIDTQDYYDGQVCSILLSTMGYTWYNGWTMDEELDNLHSMLFTTGVCLSATKYLHTSIVRHGSVAQVIDPWATSWYGCVWMQSIPRDLALGKTMGEAYNDGISHVGILHIGDMEVGPRFWWDNNENVLYYGDPDLRIFVPGTEYSDANYWEAEDVMPLRYDADTNVAGHMPFGADAYPNEIQPGIEIPVWVALATILVLLAIVVIFMAKRKK